MLGRYEASRRARLEAPSPALDLASCLWFRAAFEGSFQVSFKGC